LKILYFEASSGISGDMILGSFVDCCVPFEYLKKEIGKLNLDSVKLKKKSIEKSNIHATKIDVLFSQTSKHRNLSKIKKIINKSKLDKKIKEDSILIFTQLAKAEATIHNTSIDKVHFHEIGSIDSIVDIVGAVSCFHKINPDVVLSSPINVGGGTVKTKHGILPVPAPATAELLKGVPIYSGDVRSELCTPTGAAIIKHYADRFTKLPDIIVDKIGHGAGQKDLENKPNILRLFLGHYEEDFKNEEIAVIETNIDDMNPEIWTQVFEKLFELNVLDVYLTPVQMKKNRPGIVITILVNPEDLHSVNTYILNETSSFGVRYFMAKRTILKREIKVLKTKLGEIKIKIGYLGNGKVKFAPEFDSCNKLAKSKNIPLIQVYQEAYKAFERKFNKK
jgi:hypothetical protein